MIYDSDGFIGTLGAKIRFFRTRRKMTQKELAELCHISEPAIRNYELNNRVPSYETMNNLAAALGVSYFALADTDCSYVAGAMQALFKMEYCYRLRPIEVDGKAVLSVEPIPGDPETPLFQTILDRWLEARQQYESGQCTLEQYHESLFRYPVVPPLDPPEETIRETDEPIRVPSKKKRPRKKSKKQSS